MKRVFEKWRFVIQFLVLLGLILSPFSASAATVTTFSDTLSDSRSSTLSNHTIAWDATDAFGTTDAITLTFAAGFDTSAVVEDDVDIAGSTKGELTTAANCAAAEMVSVVMAADVLTITACGAPDFGADIGAGEVITVEIGANATSSGTGTIRIVNPTAGSYTVALAGSGYTATGEVQVAVLSGLTTTAAVSASLSFAVTAVDGVTGGQTTVNGQSIDVATTSSTVPFGTLTVNTYKAAAHDLTVSTNAGEGYTTTIRQLDGTGMIDILNSSTNEIDGFRGAVAATNASPLAWAAGTNPSGTSANDQTGWYGYTTEDATLGTGSVDRFTNPGNFWAPFDVTAYEVAYASAPVNAQTIRVGHMIEVNALQPQGSYTGVIEYICTAIF